MYRLLALDLDGTLLRHDKTVDPRDVAAIEELRRSGVTVTIATGRLRTGSIAAARACGIEGAIACMEGSHLVEVDGSITHAHHPIAKPALVREAFDGLASFVFDQHAIHHEKIGEPFAPYISTWSPDLRVVEEAVAWQTEPLAAVAIGDEAHVARVANALREQTDLFVVNFAITHLPGDRHAVLVRAKGPTKGTALAQLCERAGCTLAEAVVVGDWLNDVPMFEVAGRSFAMGGAPPAVASKATDMLERLTGAGGGIAEAIRRAF